MKAADTIICCQYYEEYRNAYEAVIPTQFLQRIKSQIDKRTEWIERPWLAASKWRGKCGKNIKVYNRIEDRIGGIGRH